MRKVKQTSFFFFLITARDFCGGPGAFTAEGPGSILGQRTKILQATKCGFKK